MLTKEHIRQAITGVLEQGGPSVNSSFNCMYRGENGRKCALGHLIKDKYYSPDLENACVGTDDINKALMLSLNISDLSTEDQSILYRLQQCHDMLSTYNDSEKFRKDFIAELNEEHCKTIPPFLREVLDEFKETA